jgi:hypothetical protein
MYRHGFPAILCAAFVAAGAIVLLFAGAAGAKRIALVIGNSACTSVAPLGDPGIGKPDEISAERLPDHPQGRREDVLRV